MLKAYQKMQSERLALPRKRSVERFDGMQSQSKMATSAQRFTSVENGLKGMARSSTMLQAMDPKAAMRLNSEYEPVDTSNILRRHARNATTVLGVDPSAKSSTSVQKELATMADSRRFMSPQPRGQG